MAAIFGPYEKIFEVLKQVDGYVEIANINSNGQSVIGGATPPVLDAVKLCKDAGFHTSELPVSHAFHTKIVAPASGPLKVVLEGLHIQSPSIPVIANISGDFYPSGADVKPQIVDILSRQVASPVQFVKGVNKLYERGARVFIEMGPKKALNGFVKDILSDNDDVYNLFTNMPKIADVESFNQALCGLYAAGHGKAKTTPALPLKVESPAPPVMVQMAQPAPEPTYPVPVPAGDDKYEKLGRLFVNFMDQAKGVFYDGPAPVKTREVSDHRSRPRLTGRGRRVPGFQRGAHSERRSIHPADPRPFAKGDRRIEYHPPGQIRQGGAPVGNDRPASGRHQAGRPKAQPGPGPRF